MRKLFLYLFFLGSVPQISAQFSPSTYQMKDFLPQSNFMNPAFMPDTKVVIGLPFVSGSSFDATAGFSFNDLFVRDADDSLVLDRENFPSNLKGSLDNTIQADIQGFYLGVKTVSGYLSISARVRAENRFNYPSEFLQWAVWGPGDDRVSNSIDLSDLGVFGVNYLEYSVNYAKKVSATLTVGARLKYLSGIAGMQGSQEGVMHISSDSVHVSWRKGQYKFAGMNQFGYNPFDSTGQNLNLNYLDLINQGNSGFGVDVGFEFKVNEKIDISASLIDMGFINWKNEAHIYETENFDYSFKGVDFVKLLTDTTENVNAEIEELGNLIKPVENTESSSFNTGLNGKFVSSFRYDLDRMGTLALTLYSGLNYGKIDPVVGLSYQFKLQRILSVVAGLGYRDRSMDNFMAGFVLKPGPVQIYLLSDRINSFLKPNNANSLNLRFGMNIVLGRAGSAVD